MDYRLQMEAELAKLPLDLRAKAERFGQLDPFQDTYGLAAYRTPKLLRSLAAPPGLSGKEIAAYLQLAFNATYLRDRFKCVYCDLDGLVGPGTYARIQVDHLVPLEPSEPEVWAGMSAEERFVIGNGPENLACACNRCNPVKANRVLGVTLGMSREQRVKASRAMLGRATSVDPYDAELREVQAFLVASG